MVKMKRYRYRRYTRKGETVSSFLNYGWGK